MHCDQCGAEYVLGEDTSFCFQCGHEFKVKENIILCQGKLKDGSPCRAEIRNDFKFCQKCGTKVDLQWVSCCSKRADGFLLGNTLDKEYTECGTPKPTEKTDKQVQDAKNDDDDVSRESHESNSKETPVLKYKISAQDLGEKIDEQKGEALISEITAEAWNELDTSIKRGPMKTEESGGSTESSKGRPMKTEESGGSTESIKRGPIKTEESGGSTESIKRVPVKTEESGGSTKSVKGGTIKTEESGGRTESIKGGPMKTEESGGSTESIKGGPMKTEESGGSTESIKRGPKKTEESGGNTESIKKEPMKTEESGGNTESIKRGPMKTEESGGSTESIKGGPMKTEESGGRIESIQGGPVKTEESGGRTESIQGGPMKTEESGGSTESIKRGPMKTEESGGSTESIKGGLMKTEESGRSTESIKGGPIKTEESGESTESIKGGPMKIEESGGSTESIKGGPIRTEESGGSSESIKGGPIKTDESGGSTESIKGEPRKIKGSGVRTELIKRGPIKIEKLGGRTESIKGGPMKTDESGGSTESVKGGPRKIEQSGVRTELIKRGPIKIGKFGGSTESLKRVPMKTEESGGNTESIEGGPMKTEESGGSTELIKGDPMKTEESGGSTESIKGWAMKTEESGERTESLKRVHMKTEESGGNTESVEGGPMKTEESGGSTELIKGDPMKTEESGGSTESIKGWAMKTEESGRSTESIKRGPMKTEESGGNTESIKRGPMKTEESGGSTESIKGGPMKTEESGGSTESIKGGPMKTEESGGSTESIKRGPRKIEGSGGSTESIKRGPRKIERSGGSSESIRGGPMKTEKLGGRTESTKGEPMKTEKLGGRTESIKGGPMKIEESGGSKESIKRVPVKTEESGGSREPKEKDKNSETAGTPRIETDIGEKNDITVHFHVLVSPAFKLDPKKDKVLIKIKLQEFGEINQTESHMVHVRHVKEFDEMQICLKLSREITIAKGVDYRYAVLKEEKDKSKVTIEEYYHKSGWKSLTYYRHFRLQEKWINKKEFHVFDGIMNPDISKMDWVMNKFQGNYTKKLEKDAEMSVEIFLPELQFTGNMTAEKLAMLDMLLSGLKKTYMTDAHCWSSDERFIQKMFDVLLSPVLKSLESETPLTGYSESQGGAERRMQIALMILTLIGQFRFRLSRHNSSVLARSLWLRPHHETGTLHDLAVLDRYNSNEKEKLKMALIEFCNNLQMLNKDPSWLFCMPLLHIISGDVRLYQVPSDKDNHDADDASWWGIQPIKRAVEKFKNITDPWLMSIQDMVRYLLPLFELDYFLPRTLMAALRLPEVEAVIKLQIMPPEICVAACVYYIKHTKPTSRYGASFISDGKKQLIRCLGELRKYLENFKKPERWSDELFCQHAHLTYKIASHMMSVTLRELMMIELHDIVAAVIQVFLQAIKMYDNIQENLGTSKSLAHLDVLMQMNKRVRSEWLNQKFSSSVFINLKETIFAWNSMLFPDSQRSPKVAQMWNDGIIKDFKFVMEQKICSAPSNTVSLVQFYCTEVDILNQTLQTCLSDLAFMAIDSGYKVIYTDFDRKQMNRFGDLLSSLFEGYWNKNVARHVNEDQKMLEFLLTWPPFSHFMALTMGDTKILTFLRDDCATHLMQCTTFLSTLMSALQDGTITLENLELILSAKEKFLEFTNNLKSVEEGSHLEFVVAKAVAVRQKEVDCFKHQTEQIKILWNLCQHIPSVDTSDVQQKLQHLSASQLRVVDVCESAHVDSLEDTQAYKPQIKYFLVPTKVLMMLDALESRNQSRVFHQLWEETCKKTKVINLEGLITHVWQPVNREWFIICDEIDSGDITFRKFEKRLGKLCENSDCGAIVEEMMLLGVGSKTRTRRIEQLKQYRQLRHYVQGAKTLQKFAEAFELMGDFEDVSWIALKDKHGETKMKDFDKSLMQTCELLKEMTQERSTCLKALINSKNLVEWLRLYMKGLKELKVFVQLASISAGEGDMEVAKVNCLQAATGYAPLIFDLDEGSGYKTLLEKCRMVWDALKDDPELPRKLESISCELDWLTSVKQAHGSVEVASLEQASAINTSGVYFVGKLNGMKENEPCLDLHKTIQLAFTWEGKKKEYTYEQILDLQSRLMLVAGKVEQRKENVDRFTMVFDSITRLASVYIKLISAGCVLYKNWQARFFCCCHPVPPICACIQFREPATPLEGRLSYTKDITDFITKITRFMEKCLQKWLDYINEKRNKYFELNFFTTDQLVILQQELVKISKVQGPDAKTYPLLSAVKVGCTYEDIEDAMRRALLDMQEVQFEVYKDKEGLVCCSDREDSVTEESIRDVQLVGPDEVTRNENVEPLLNDLERIWKDFLSSVSFSMEDYLCLEHLGLILKRLAEKDTLKILRPFPPGLIKGSPNLIVCPKADILRTLLSVYMMDSTQPLPQADEVLMCNSHTTLDQLDVFWRRSLGDRSSRIHCLVNADLLDFEVSDRGERYLENYMQQIKSKGYCLIVICSSENEYRSRMVTALDKYRRQFIPQLPQKIASYIQKKLQVDIPVMKAKFKPAAVVDPDRSCVRIVKSSKAGMGKSLYVKRRVEDLSSQNQTHGRQCHVTVPLQDRVINVSKVTQILLKHMQPPRYNSSPRIFHLDISYEVQEGVDFFLFNLLILGCLTDSFGHVWRRSARDLYLVETMTVMGEISRHVHKIFDFLPYVICKSPMETLSILTKRGTIQDFRPTDQLFDEKEFRSSTFQRPCEYLSRLDQGLQRTTVDPSEPQGTPTECLLVLLRHCGVHDPSWAELHHFVWFLNTQLRDLEKSVFCSAAVAEDLPGFRDFVLRFLIQMSRDFSTRSLVMSEESPTNNAASSDDEGGEREQANEDLAQFQIRRTWERSPHPYLFFNPDGQTLTFVGFNIDKCTGNLVDLQTGSVLEKAIMARNLYKGLVRNHAPIKENFDSLSRLDKIVRLCKVMGNESPYDPDETYELTTDNVKKILAIYMRFRCDIPVIIMGETGCGKTRLVKFLCALQTPAGIGVKNMILMKVHGGITNADIIKKVQEAEKLAQTNARNYGPHMYTVLFFDEANTTESIGLIKEILCDKSMEGGPLTNCPNLKMVAACNPYRKHSDTLIRRLEQAGLGYHVDADKTADRLGRVPMRRLVYRVQPLPQSLLPLVWDFGQLNTQIEDLYIRQMVIRYIAQGQLPNIPDSVPVISRVLTASQDFMRNQKDECSFVSLRDVDRVLSVMSWFYTHSTGKRTLFDMMDKFVDQDESFDTEKEEGEEEVCRSLAPPQVYQNRVLDDITRSFILALGVCYHACLKKRKEYREHIWRYFGPPLKVPDGPAQIEADIIRCQDVFLDNVQLDKNIARNTALKENMFMMVICTELRIPLFLVGKPGSSKSLAKTIVAEAMQGNAARVDLFREFKQVVQMVSFQCSPLSTPDGILGTFRQCAQFQKDKDLDRFVSVVVLDEVGLAEDSPRMPLKTLHPLLEDGCQGDEEPEPYKKVAFIGISNWALDPAKMNRGILVQREVPDLQELENSAKGICSSDATTLNLMKPLIKPLAESYLQLFTKASKDLREFYGLRDFYSLIKMIYSFCEKSKKVATWHQLLHAIKRNFGGLNTVNPVETFTKRLSTQVNKDAKPQSSDPDCSPTGLIHACLFDVNKSQCESRYLLLLTENYGALTILQQQILNIQDVIIIFGSSFPSDQEYTQVCRNINRIKVCMETGNTVVLLNLENLYESLYDALNQYYVYFGGNRYVDLGLGTHRVKCRVHTNFRLIVVAEKDVVYQKFPIPLINRLEKHFLTVNTMLTPEQGDLAKRLEKWADTFSTVVTASDQHSVKHGRGQRQRSAGGVFIGYHADTCSALVLFVWEDLHRKETKPSEDKILEESKKLLLWSATPEAVVRLGKCQLPRQEVETLKRTFWEEQTHDSLAEYLKQSVCSARLKKRNCFAQVTTHSKLLSPSDKEDISKASQIPVKRVSLEALQSFDTEQQFSRKIRSLLESNPKEELLLVVQCDSGDTNASLVACAKYCILDEHQQMRDRRIAPCHVIFIIQLPRIAGGCFTGSECGMWHSVHIDDLRAQSSDLPTIQSMIGVSIATVMERATSSPASGKVVMETSRMRRCNVLEELRKEDMAWQREIRNLQYMLDYDQDHQPYIKPSTDLEFGQGHQLQDIGLHPDPLKRQSSSQSFASYRPNAHSLILACVHSALAMVKDRKEVTERSTERITLVLKLLHETSTKGVPNFFQGVCSHIVTLLKEKEDKSGHNPSDWLQNEASKPENINKAGTFRRACIQYLESRISPILAGIIAHIDTNQNLDILSGHISQGDWVARLWLHIFNTPFAIQLKYSDLQSPAMQQELREVIVKTTGCEGHTFQAELPFSWLIFEQIDAICRTAHENVIQEDQNTFNLERIVKVFKETPLGRLLNEFQGPVSGIVQLYTKDFINMTKRVQTDAEREIVHRVILESAQSAFAHNPTCVLTGFVSIHEVYQHIASHLAYFQRINQVWPGCSETLRMLQQENPDHQLFNEALDVQGLSLLLDQLDVQDAKSFSKPEVQARWMMHVLHFRSVVEQCLTFCSSDPKLNVRPSLVRARQIWTRIMVMKLFIEHVGTMDRGEDHISVKNCMLLCQMLERIVDLKQIASFKEVESFLKRCNGAAIEAFYKNQEAQRFKDYQSRCNSFFMNVVSQLCFADNMAPSDEVVDMLLGYITMTTKPGKNLAVTMKQTKELTVFNECVDPNPVFRSFLLQLLLKTSKERVYSNLEKYLNQAQEIITSRGGQQNEYFNQLCHLVVRCLEDQFHIEATSTDEVEFARRLLKEARQLIHHYQLNMKLFGIAMARFGLSVTARYVHLAVVSTSTRLTSSIQALCESAVAICQEPCPWPKTFFIKYLCRSYGIDSYQAICQKREVSFLRGLCMEDSSKAKVNEVSDRYIVCGPDYTRIRDAVTKVAHGENIEKLDQAVKELRVSNKGTELLVCLALHREITLASLHGKTFSPKAIDSLQKYCANAEHLKNKEIMQALIQNKYGRKVAYLTVTPGLDLRQQGVLCLLVHCDLVLRNLHGDSTLMQPLVRMATQPETLTDPYLPTMPQDDVAEIREALLAARGQHIIIDPNPSFYRCPNGHPYVIGDCGRPNQIDRCRECGAQIGGQNHKLLPGNTRDNQQDMTKTGHILGAASQRAQSAIPEREMSPACCAVVRLMLHLSMMLGANHNLGAISQLIKPKIAETMVTQFLMEHTHRDLNDLHRALGRSIDDVLMTLHCILSHVMQTCNEKEKLGEEICGLRTKNARREWEKMFSGRFLAPVLQKQDAVLQEMNQNLARDKRLDPLMGLVFETNTPQETVSPTMPQENPSMWSYRTRITIDHLSHEFDAQMTTIKNNQNQHNILHLFLKEEHHLQALRFIPSILKLHRILFQKFQRRLGHAEASSITVDSVIREDRGNELEALIQDYANAWELVRNSLSMTMQVLQEYCRKGIDRTTPVSQLLPTSRGAGLCAWSLVRFLLKKQNDFLEEYCRVQKNSTENLPKVKARDITPAHLISYHPEQDILPLVLANCNYSFEVGKGTAIEYNFANLERQIVDRFLFGKSWIDIEIEEMVYRADYTNAATFRMLDDKIPQVPLSSGAKHKISEEFRSLPDLCQALDNLDIAISFLKSIGGNPENDLNKFMVETLKMEQSLHNTLAKLYCQYRHVKSLWLLLSLEKTKILAKHEEMIFDGIPEDFHELLTPELGKDLKQYLQKLPLKCLIPLLELMFECIVLVISVLQNPDDEDFVDAKEKKFGDYLQVLLYDKEMDVPLQLENFPQKVLSKYSVSAWELAYRTLQDRERSGYRN